MNILNFLKYNENISTSGLPTIEEFNAIASNDFKIVIALTTPSDSLIQEDEEMILTNHAISYIHIPVVFRKPKIEEFEQFRKILNAFKDDKVFIHCSKNYRVTAFLYLYEIIENGTYKEDLLKKFWQPNETWQTFIKETLEYYKT